MARIIILDQDRLDSNSCSSTEDIFKDDECLCNKNNVESELDRIVNSDCSLYLKKFLDSIQKLGFYRCYWEPIEFRRNVGLFQYEAEKYILTLEVKVDEGKTSRYYTSRFNTFARLNIKHKTNLSSNKTIDILNMTCERSDKSQILAYLELLNNYIYQVFGIDLKRWDQILEMNDHYKTIGA